VTNSIFNKVIKNEPQHILALLPSADGRRRIFKVLLILLSAFLMFGGPTYLLFVLQKFDIYYPVLLLIGLASFIVGVILFTHLIRGEKT